MAGIDHHVRPGLRRGRRRRPAVLRALRSGVLGLGPFAEEFEEARAKVAGTAHAVAVSSGTAGLHLIVRALGIGEGDEVLVPSFTFAASANAFIYEGATPVFVDIEPETYNLDPDRADAVGERPGPRPPWWSTSSAIPPIGTRSVPAVDGLPLIDDCCEAIGATYRGRPLGSFGAAGCFAFYPNKQMTTGEGGMIVTDDAALAALCRSLRNQGRGEMGTWLQHERLGFNYRWTSCRPRSGVSQIASVGRRSSRSVPRWPACTPSGWPSSIGCAPPWSRRTSR